MPTVLIAGSGIAGLAAAVSAKENGAETVVVLESENVVGGSSRLSGGMMVGAGHRFQVAAGIVDSPESFFSDYMNLNNWNLNAEAARVFTQESGPTIDWLADHGVPFHPEPVYSGPEFTPRAIAVRGHGQVLIDALHRSARRLGVDFALEHRVERIIAESGKISGVLCGGEVIPASAVVIATGGFGASPDKLAEYFPSSTSAGDWAWYMGADSARGDALDLASDIDAKIVGHDRGLRMLHPNFIKAHESYLPAWLVLVNSYGVRYVDESAPYGIMDRLTRAQGDKGFLIFDEGARDLQQFRTSPAYKQSIPGRDDLYNTPNWNPSMIEFQLEAGLIKVASSVEELAIALDLPAVQLVETIRQYNSGAETGQDSCGKDARFIRPIVNPPFYGAEVRLATIAVTSAGLAIDGTGAVLNHLGNRIEGVFAAGECTGGVLGDVYLGGGNSLNNGAVFGRLAGKHAARYSDS